MGQGMKRGEKGKEEKRKVYIGKGKVKKELRRKKRRAKKEVGKE